MRMFPEPLVNGRLELFRNYDPKGFPLDRPSALLIDSAQLESGAALDDAFKQAAADEIERFKRERVERSGNREDADNISPEELLRNVMHRRQTRPAGRADPLRDLRLHAHGRLGHQHGYPRPWRSCFRDAAPVRTGHWARATPTVVRPERGCGPLSRPRDPVFDLRTSRHRARRLLNVWTGPSLAADAAGRTAAGRCADSPCFVKSQEETLVGPHRPTTYASGLPVQDRVSRTSTPLRDSGECEDTQLFG